MNTIKRALRLIESGAFDEAEEIADTLSSDSANAAAAHEIRFHIALAQDQWELSKRHVIDTIRIDPKRSELLLQLAKKALQKNKLGDAFDAANALAIIEPMHRVRAYALLLREFAAFKMNSPNLSFKNLEHAADMFLQLWDDSEHDPNYPDRKGLLGYRFCLCAGLIGSNERALQALKLIYPESQVIRGAKCTDRVFA